MKNIIHNILLEFAEKSSDGLSKLEISILKNLNSKGFTPKTKRSTILGYLGDDLGLSSKEAIELYFLFLHNYNSDGDYANLSDLKKIKRVNFDSETKQLKTANNTAKDLVRAKIPFKGSNTTGQYINDVYVVKSYGWYPIFVNKNGQWYENANRYSRSTGKQMGQMRPVYDTIVVSKSELEDIIYK